MSNNWINTRYALLRFLNYYRKFKKKSIVFVEMVLEENTFIYSKILYIDYLNIC